MKNKINIFKMAVTIILIATMVLSISSIVFADNNTTTDDPFAILESTNNTNSSGNKTSNDTNEYENALEKNVIEKNTNTNINANTNTNTSGNLMASNTNRNLNTTNSLAKTGIGDTNSIITLIIVICGIVAIYSYKKLNDYKKL